MKKVLLMVLTAALLFSSAMAEPLTLASDLAGEAFWPEDATADNATYVYRYAYPQVEDNDETCQMINEFYGYLVEDALAFTVPMTADGLETGGVQAYTNIASQVTCNSDAWFSVLVTTETFLGASTSEVYAGHTFARTGAKAGTVVSLPYLLGILDPEEEDTWMQDRQTQKANELVWGLVWDIIEQQKADGTVAYDEDLTYEGLCADFYPEEDFYLDADGNPVFFLQAATVASAAEGVLTFPFSMAELLDEV